MSVAHTEQAVVERRKWVTRRTGWLFLQPGDYLTLCRKVMGRKKGEPLVRLAEVRVIDVRRERLDEIPWFDVTLEGLRLDDLDAWGLERRHGRMPAQDGPGSVEASFVRFFTAHMGGAPDQVVTRIEWDYTDTPVTTVECSRPGDPYRLFESGPVLDVHLAAARGGGRGPCLCGFDRHAAKVGFNVGGGTTGPSIKHEICQGCVDLAVGRPINGLHADLVRDHIQTPELPEAGNQGQPMTRRSAPRATSPSSSTGRAPVAGTATTQGKNPPATQETRPVVAGGPTPDVCPRSERIDGPYHSVRFDGDDPYTICVYCGETRDAITGRIVKAGATA
jgi:hypothetical protein